MKQKRRKTRVYQYEDLSGQKFNRLLVLSKVAKRLSKKLGRSKSLCLCDCGRVKVISSSKVKTGVTKACGCLINTVDYAVYEDLSGQEFGELLVLSKVARRFSKRKGTHCFCLCSCGAVTVVRTSHLKYGNTKSCGHLQPLSVIKMATTHGLRHHRIYDLWRNIVRRCHDPKATAYEVYGGRGIIVEDEWRYDFVAVYDWCINNGWEEGLQIDRRDNNKNYGPTNCHFISSYKNNHNKRRLMITNKTGYAGVELRADTGKYTARIGSKLMVNGKKCNNLGCYDTKEQAVTARNNFIKLHDLPHRVQEIK